VWVEDANGRLSAISSERTAANRRRSLLPFLAPLGCSLAGALLFRIHPTFEFFLYFGIGSVAVNVTMSFVYATLKRATLGDMAINYFTLSASILTLIIPYSMFYLFFAFVLNGFRLTVGQ
jgi:hypothetical protein